MARRRLPDRRPAEVLALEFGGRAYQVGIGFDPASGAPLELFVRGAKVGSDADALQDDMGVALSLLLQHGVAPADIVRSLGRDGDGGPASLMGAAAALLAGCGVE